MGSISSGVGLVSGINSAQLIEQLLALESGTKTTLQARVASLTGKRTALLDVNARLLNLKGAAAKFRTAKVFKSALATTSDNTIASATADSTTPPGSYQLFVKRLAATSQFRTQGYATKNASPLGLDQLTFELGDVGVARGIDLATLNGGAGVRRGKIAITDKSGATATIDLSAATSLSEIVERINSSADIAITASIVDERLKLVDSSLGSGQLKVVDLAGGAMASDLGIAGSTGGASITSSQLNRLGGLTTLASLNDGNGVFIRDDAVDFQLQTGTDTYDITLGRVDLPIEGSTLLADLNNGAGVKINSTDAADFVVRATNGVQVSVNLGTVLDTDGTVADEAVTTVQQMLTRVNDTLADEFGDDKVVMRIRSDGKGFELEDTLGGADPLRVIGAGPNGSKTASNLGIYTGPSGGSGATIVGTTIKNHVSTPQASTIQEIIDRIYEQTDHQVVASINSAGTGLQLTAASGTVTVLAGDPDGSSQGVAVSERTARDLGILGLSGASVSGTRILAGAGTVLASTLNGGDGMNGADGLTITDAANHSTTITGLSAYSTIGEIVSAINTAAADAGVLASVAISSDNMSLTVTDSSGGAGQLGLSGDAATALKIDGVGDSTGKLKGGNLQLRYISEAMSVARLNYGKGIGTGSFKLTDSSGESATVDIDSNTSTLYDVMREINSRGLFIEARLNDHGDGIILVDTNTDTPTSKMKVEDVGGGVAASLGIAGTASTVGGSITGTYEKTVDLATADTLTQVIAKINAAGVPVSASLVNTGAGGTPFYMSLASTVVGSGGRLLIDSGSVNLGLTAISEGRDAEVFFGDSDPSLGLLLRSSTNTFTDVVGGLDVKVLKPSDTAITIDVQRDVDGIKQSVKDFIAAFNDAIGRIDQYDSYDIDTEKKGPLLGDPTLARARQVLFSTIQGKGKNVEGQYQYLSQVGIKVSKDGNLTIDEAKFDAAYANDPTAVEKLFVTFEQQTVAPTAFLPGVTVGSSSIVNTALGFGDLIDQAMKSMTDTIDGALPRASKNFQELIDRANNRIKEFDTKLESKRARLQKQFQDMETALQKLQGQQGALSSILGTLG